MKKIMWLTALVMVFSFLLVQWVQADGAKKPVLEVKIGEGENAIKMQVNGYIQTQFEHYDKGDDTFKLLRARPRVKGDLGEHIDFFVQLDLAYSTVMRDAWLELDYVNYAKLRMGQFLLPFGWQTPVSPYNLLTINYAQVVDKLNGGDDLRDIGLMLHGNFKDCGTPILDKFNYAVAGVNGEGSNASDQNDPKNFVGRVGFKPLDGLDLGASYYVGKRGSAKYDRKRWGVDAIYKLDNLLIQGEYIDSSDDTVASTIETHTLEGKGYFVEVGYKITPQIQPVFKYDVWDPKVAGTYGELTKYVVGLNVYLNDWVKVQGAYEFREEEKNDVNDDALFVQLGLAF
jgi:phosphate-selective porin